MSLTVLFVIIVYLMLNVSLLIFTDKIGGDVFTSLQYKKIDIIVSYIIILLIGLPYVVISLIFQKYKK